MEGEQFEDELLIEQEFAYGTDEDSVFNSFEQPDIDKPFPLGRKRINIS